MTNTRITIDGAPVTNFDDKMKMRSIVEIRSGANNHLYCIYENSSGHIGYKKSTNGGATWGSFTVFTGANSIAWDSGVDVWYDRWSPGNTTGNIIHVVGVNSTNDDSFYFGLDTSDDSMATNNNTQIVATEGAKLSSQGGASICVAANGDIFAGWTTDTSDVGVSIYRSTDSGANWTQIYDNTEWTQDLTDDGDFVILVPLKTDNDILAIGTDDSSGDVKSRRWDNVGDGWGSDSAALTSGSGTFTNTSQLQSATCNEDGDVCFVYPSGFQPPSATNFLESRFYDESAGDTWDTEVKVFHTPYSGGANQLEAGAVSICADKNNVNLLYLALTMGEWGSNGYVELLVSSDKGSTWSQEILIGASTFIIDDYQNVYLPAQLVTDTSPLPYVFMETDLTDLFNISGGIPILKKTGNVKDDAGVNVVGCDVDGFLKNLTSFANKKASYYYLGHAVTDSSGNYVFNCPNPNNDSNPEFQLIFDDDQVADETDASRRFSS